MNQAVPNVLLPPVPRRSSGDKFHDVNEHLKRLSSWAEQLVSYQQRTFQQMTAQLNSQVQGVGPTLTAASTLVVTNPIHHVTGTAAIKTIVAPPGFSGPLFLIADQVWSLATGGNIKTAEVPLQDRFLDLLYDNVVALWYINCGCGF